ncbi:hypothetical protein Acid345_3423 [Candidatus Koribacter versatilis Ellin345]|uniref:Uncharacterized protein n=1 Tax=Koribacter versatilis (strain Ellin345) TaxID=204669 RepID=Q1IL26_KORVE|nr:hypothetical protein [Candidatus Koribacter versatilis]ABF42424.1 hypothetical protein Acid345_3423 [Candidatus Koribacter versatilis Ellin345]
MAATADTQEQIARAQLGIPVPFCFGPVIGAGNTIIQHQLADGTIVAMIALHEGEGDGIDALFINKKRVDHTDTTLVHYHPGTDGILGDGMIPISTGGDQRVDLFYNDLPSTVKKVTFSRTAYIALKVPPDPGAPDAGLEVLGFYRSLKCKQFDNTGTQTAYAYTMNHAWHAFEMCLRFFVRPEMLIGAALTAAELARFDFPSFYDSAQYFDEALSSGAKRFEGGVAVAQATTWANLQEQVLRMCRSYMIEVNGKICLYADKPRTPVFTLSAKHTVPGSWTPDKSNIRGSANYIQGQFRDLNAKASMLIAGDGLTRAGNVVTASLVNGDGDPSYFDGKVGDGIQIQGALDPSFDLEGAVASIVSGAITVAQTGPDASSGLGTVSHIETKYAQRVVTLNHDRHQLAVGTRGVGMTAMRKRKSLQLDYGNNTWERVSRLVQFECYRYIGMDADPYFAPWDATVQAFFEAQDDDGNLFAKVCPGDVITVDGSVSEEDQGDYEVIEAELPQITVGGDSGSGNKGTAFAVNLSLKRVVDDSFTDVPLPEDDTDFGSVEPGTGFGGRNYVVRSNPLTAHDAGSDVTINIANFNIGFDTHSPDPYYFGSTSAHKVFATTYYIYVLDPFGNGGSCAFKAVLALDSSLEDAGWLFVGSILTPADGAADTDCNNDGGGGDSSLVPNVSMPTAYDDGGLVPGTSLADVYDGNPRTSADLGCFGGRDPDFNPINDAEAVWRDFTAIAGLGSMTTVNLKVISAGTGTGLTVSYSLDGGSTWTTIRTGGGWDKVTDTVPLTPAVDLSQLRVKGHAHQGLTSGMGCDLEVYQAWVEA